MNWREINLLYFFFLHDKLYPLLHMFLAALHIFCHSKINPSTNKTGRHDITELLLKVALNTITLTLKINQIFILTHV